MTVYYCLAFLLMIHFQSFKATTDSWPSINIQGLDGCDEINHYRMMDKDRLRKVGLLEFQSRVHRGRARPDIYES
ncbi:hypothetical protein E1B28_011870 [Marasmius oreades]|uniref:Uncharacterized protein n=1 Tax=Marasmius oreades TaxID=181124 RepID=A0A9P7UQE8_9AGAR|nr:uncharacterized protein E1B28_011870 [Marasmius oreades]KAG7090273.1 hypothetical protein E1B28_011870 [Marasmius oreades]